MNCSTFQKLCLFGWLLYQGKIKKNWTTSTPLTRKWFNSGNYVGVSQFIRRTQRRCAVQAGTQRETRKTLSSKIHYRSWDSKIRKLFLLGLLKILIKIKLEMGKLIAELGHSWQNHLSVSQETKVIHCSWKLSDSVTVSLPAPEGTGRTLFIACVQIFRKSINSGSLIHIECT